MSAVQERPASTGRGRATVERKVQKLQSRTAPLQQNRTQAGVKIPKTSAESVAPVNYSMMAAKEFEAQDEIDSVVIRAIRTKRKRKRVKALLLLKVGLVFVLGLLVVFRYASITEMGYKVSKAKTEYEQLAADNERLRVNIKSGMNLNELTNLAKEKFDMQQPQTYQMVVLDIQPADQTEIFDIKLEEESDDRAWYTRIYDSFREFLGLI